MLSGYGTSNPDKRNGSGLSRNWEKSSNLYEVRTFDSARYLDIVVIEQDSGDTVLLRFLADALRLRFSGEAGSGLCASLRKTR